MQNINTSTIPIYFNTTDLIKVIRLLESNHIKYVLSKTHSDEICVLEMVKIKQENDFKKAFYLYLSLPLIKRKRQFNVSNKVAIEKNVVTKSALRNHLRQRKSFTLDSRGIDETLDQIINSLIEQKFIIELDKSESEKLNVRSSIYKLYSESETKLAFDATKEKANSFKLALYPIPCVVI